MRIVAGTVGGRNLFTPEGDDVRPTKDRVREAVFNSLHSHGLVEDCTYLDLFAGSGALGLEALSRGAAHCTFVDNDRRSIEIVNKNIEELDFGDETTVRLALALTVVDVVGPCDVALLDPPYDFDEWTELLGVVPASAVVIESDHPIDPGPGWEILKEKRYAGTVVVIAQREVAESPERDASTDETNSEEGSR
jgi:16S rRNA (guanine966-N2)-methyltransferase